MKVWATTVREEKITKDLVFEYDHISNEDDFVAVLQQICEKMDIPTPVVTYVNFNHYVLFNTTKFRRRDFVESIDFDYFNLEAIPDKKKK